MLQIKHEPGRSLVVLTKPMNLIQLSNMDRWCKQHLGDRHVITYADSLGWQFENESDAIQFFITWNS